jgi:ubiquinol-cytochrome c reductase cytochrome b subunit
MEMDPAQQDTPQRPDDAKRLTLRARALQAFEERTGLVSALSEMAKHPVPPDAGWWYVFGSATLVAFIIQVVTGIALATAYVSSTGDAYDSLQFITHQAFIGNFLRGMHYFGASAMVLLVGIHMGQVFLMGAYKYPREINWLTGVGLLGLTLAMGFTGQLLRWDQNAVWSVFVAAELAGRTPVIGHWISEFILAGNTLGGATLSRFFAFHVFFIPALVFGFVGLHLYLALHDGISEPPEPGRKVDPRIYRDWYERMLHERGVPFWPDAAWRDVVFAAVVVSAIAALALIFGPPELDKPPNPSILQADPRPDWYFLWIFAVMALIPPALETYVMILGPLLVGAVLIALPIIWNKGERSPSRRPWAVASVIVIVMAIGTLWIEGRRSPWSPNFAARPLPDDVVGASGGPVASGAQLFNAKGCEFCHDIEGYGGRRGPILTDIGDRLTADEITIRILGGGTNMPAFAGTLKPGELNDLVAFLLSRKTH